MDSYNAQFNGYYHNEGQTGYGEAGLTSHEFGRLRNLYDQGLSNFDGDKEEARDYVATRMNEDGWMIDNLEDVHSELLATSAIKHGCVVAEALMDERGKEKAKATLDSYITKNWIDRQIQAMLQKKGDNGVSVFDSKPDLKKDWYSPLERNPEHKNTKVKYPEGLNPNYIYGISKPARFMIAQTLKEILFASRNLDKFPELENFQIPWIKIEGSIQEAISCADITAKIAITMVDHLRSLNIDNARIVDLIMKGMSPSGPLKEHGPLDSTGQPLEVNDVWDLFLVKLFERAYQDSTLQDLLGKFQTQAELKRQAAMQFLAKQGNDYDF